MAHDNAGGWPDDAKPGVPMEPEKSQYHWLLWVGLSPADRGHETVSIYRWEKDGWWDGRMHRHHRFMVDGWRYLGPCLTPAEVAAREAAVLAMREMAMREMAARHFDEEAAGIGVRHAHKCKNDAAAIRALPLPDAAQAALDAVVQAAVEREREACAAMFDSNALWMEEAIAAAIRARGSK